MTDTFGKRLAAVRDERRMTQVEVAKAAGISATFLSELENDHRGVGVDTLIKIADALDSPLDYLARGRQVTSHRDVVQNAFVALDVMREIADAAWQCVALDEYNDAPWDDAWERLKVAVKDYRPVNR